MFVNPYQAFGSLVSLPARTQIRASYSALAGDVFFEAIAAAAHVGKIYQ